jgi:threonine synthase
MKFFSTRNNALATSFESALFQGLAPDGGLYIPDELPRLSADFLEPTKSVSLLQLGETIISQFLPDIAPADLREIIKNTLTFPIPLVSLGENKFVLEVFHGPTLAFKDVGARFMANMLAYFLKKQNQTLNILVATSGDTGSAIAHAFHQIPGVEVFILYPSKKITQLQEKQMTTLGGNIHALEVAGNFDDCQRLVKIALLDHDIKAKKTVTTANSINISRLLPQVIYHGFGITSLRQQGIAEAPVLSVPSGNFGNLTAAIYAGRMGFEIRHFIAATNINAIVPHYLETGLFTPEPSRESYSNAMDVGNPSNFERLQALYANDHQKMRDAITGISISDAETLAGIRDSYEKTGYILDPHTAVGVMAAKQFMPESESPLIITATAHPAKFPEVIQRALGFDIELPDSLQQALAKPTLAMKISADFLEFKRVLLCS